MIHVTEYNSRNSNITLEPARMKKESIFIGALLVASVGCSQPPSAQDSPTPAATAAATATATPAAAVPPAEFSDEVKKQAEELVASREKGHFPYKQLSVKENGPAFVYLATTSDDPEIVSEALRGMEKTYTANKAYKKTNKADETVDAAILKALNSDNKSILYYGLEASGDALGDEPNQQVLAKLLEIATSHPELGARVEAVDAMIGVKDPAHNPEVFKAFVKALQDDAPVASMALFRSGYAFVRADTDGEMKKVIDGLIKHEDPGVRGRAVEAFRNFHDGENDLLIETLTPLLKDKNSFVRSVAVGELARVKDPRAIDLIVTLLDDKEKNTYDIKYTNLLGKPDSIHHDGSAWSRVDDATLRALDSASNSQPKDEQFEYDKIDYKKVDEDIAAQVKKAKDWYAKYKASKKS